MRKFLNSSWYTCVVICICFFAGYQISNLFVWLMGKDQASTLLNLTIQLVLSCIVGVGIGQFAGYIRNKILKG